MKSIIRYLLKNVPLLRTMKHAIHTSMQKVSACNVENRTVTPNTVIFQAYNGRYACSPKAIYEAMLSDPRCANFSFIWVVHDREEYPHLTIKDHRTSLVEYRSPEYFAAFASTKYWVVNNLLSPRILKSSEQVMVQTWHGTPLKRLRSDIIENSENAMNSAKDFRRKNTLDVQRFDHLISPSRFASRAFTTAFDLKRLSSSKILREIGYPRNDVLATATPSVTQQARRALGIPHGKRVLLYTPTWRDDSHDNALGYVHHNGLDFEALHAALGDEYIVLYRAHYMIAKSFNFTRHGGFVRDVSKVDDINDLYLASDALITDYSSTMFDYANLGRPIFYYMYDRELYGDRLRGFYFDCDELPGEIFEDQDSLAAELQDLEGYWATHRDDFARFSRRFNPLDDGRAAQRAVELLLGTTPRASHTVPITAVRPRTANNEPQSAATTVAHRKFS